MTSYVNSGKFEWIIPYWKITTSFWIPIVIVGAIFTTSMLGLSDNLRKECTGNNEWFSDYWVCICNTWYIRENWMCKITLEQSILNSIPYGSFLREYKEIPWENWVYLWIYIKNYKILEEWKQDYGFNWEKMPLYFDCFWNVEGQWISWDYYLFTFKNWKLLSDKEVPIWFRINISNRLEWPKLIFSYYNTRYNNSYYFLKKEIGYNDENNFSIEKTSLVNFKDYNWDWIDNEFFLVDHWDQVCWHNNYLIAWYDKKAGWVIIYWIKDKDWTIWYWWDNFIPDEKGEIINWWNCWDHWAWTELKSHYKFDKKNNMYLQDKSETKVCPEGTY